MKINLCENNLTSIAMWGKLNKQKICRFKLSTGLFWSYA